MKGFFLSFVCICLYALGAVGGVALALAGHYWVIAVGCVAVSCFAFPFVKKLYKDGK